MSAGGRGRGRPPSCSHDLALRIALLHLQGLGYQAIGDLLNAEGIPTPLGRPHWHKSYVDRLLHTQYVREILDELQANRS